VDHKAPATTPRLLTEASFPAEPLAAAQVRAVVRAALGETVTPVVVEDVMVVASELVSNSVMHAGLGPGDEIGFRLWRDVRIRVEVEDRGRGFDPAVRRRGTSSPYGGRGLDLVAALSDRWGVQSACGVLAWAEIAVPPAPPVPPGAGVEGPAIHQI
jgi:anti-sigma regulatory factor (Ser/Thr protein kinase)